jgi:lysophospholipase L1-like esterase
VTQVAVVVDAAVAGVVVAAVAVADAAADERHLVNTIVDTRPEPPHDCYGWHDTGGLQPEYEMQPTFPFPRLALKLAIHVLAMLGQVPLACVVAKRVAASEFPDPDPARFEQDIRAFEAWDRQNSFPNSAVLFVGSSSIRMWPTAESFPDATVINRGFGGSHTSDVNYFAERIVVKYKPKLIVFYAGDNDIESGKPPEQVFDDFQSFSKTIHERLPGARIVYLPIKPSLARWPKWPRMQQVNAQVEKLMHTDRRLVYVDTATPMLGTDGRPRPELFLDDGLHLNDNGYRLWTKALSPIVNEAHAAN